MIKALPLRIHPDKDLAARLHQKDPENYNDENHKPEIAAALITFELFISFKPLSKIQTLLHHPYANPYQVPRHASITKP
jgi:mannose-6-phosphate isomerase